MAVIKSHLTLSVWFSTGADWIARFCFLSWSKVIPLLGSTYGCRDCCLISSQRLVGFSWSRCCSILLIRGESNSSFCRVWILPLVSLIGSVLSNSKKIDGKRLWCDTLRNLLPTVQFKHEKHPWRSITFSKFPGFILQFY